MRWMLVTLIVAVWASLSFGIGGDMGVGTEPLTDGSEAYPWLIEDFDDFQVFCGNSSYWDDYTRLECDLDLDPALPGRVAYATAVIAPDTDQNTEWFQGVAYSGVFDGAGHRILNLTLSTPTWSCNYLSLFGKVDTQGRICHLTLESVNIHSGSQGLFVGGVCGINLGRLSDCHVTGEIGLHHWAIERVGGLCGGNNNAGLIENCSAQIIISSYYEQTSCGGLVGYINGGIINDSYTNVSLTTGSESTDTGGLCGYISNGSINRCHVSGTVTGEDNTGGLCGSSINSNISQCYTECYVDGHSWVGGLCGKFESGVISQSYTTGDVSGYQSYAAGLCGFAIYITLDRCYSISDVSGRYFVGGLCGDGYDGDITQSFYNGSVMGEYLVGGLFGDSTYLSITQCYSTGSVTGDRNVGGLCGTNAINEINQCYTNALISGNTDVGGICGYDSSGNVTDCFWNVDNAPDATSRVGWELTSSQMTQAASYLGWTDGSWTIDEGVAPSRLAWENQPGTPITTDWSGFPPTYTGSGTYGDPYQISTVADLQCLQRRTPDWSKYFILVNDIDLSGVTFDRSVIAPGSYFTGSFNGQGNRIANLTIDAANQQAVGFVNRLDSNGRITDLELLNASISGDCYVAGICAEVSSGMITRCRVTGQISGHDIIGGICGSIGEVTLSQCCFTGDIDVSSINIYHDGNAGGICGIVGYKATVYQCYAIADISALTYSSCRVGGISGNNSNGVIRQCYASGTIIADSLDEDEYVGGVCGLLGFEFYNNNATIENCFWDAQMSGIDIPCVLADPYPGTFTNVEGLTTAEMQSLEPYADGGWSIGYGYGAATTWWLPVNTTPRLNWEAPLVGISNAPGPITLGTDQISQLTFEVFSPTDGQTLNWTIAGFETCPWITQIAPTSGVSTGPLDKTTVTIDIDDHGNDSGYYECMLAITDQTGAGIYLPIMVNILLAGDGSENAPYRIESFEDFALFADPVNAATYWVAGVHTRLENDLDLDPALPGRQVYTNAPVAPDTDNSTTWYQGNSYKGVFDGNGYRIVNLTIDTAGIGKDYLGLFGFLENTATVENLEIEGVTIACGDGSDLLAGLCGVNYGSIISCCVNGSITSGSNSTRIGGLSGVSHEQSKIAYCYTNIDLTSDDTTQYLGGLCGKAYHAEILNSYAAGTVFAGIGSSYVGGFCGQYDSGNIAGNFWDTTSSGMVDPEAGQPDTDGLIGKTTAEMQQMSTFAGNPANWDFVDETINGVEDHWRMCVDGVDYPRLRWEFTTGDLSCPDGVDLVDVAVMAANWLESDCITNPAACGYADLDGLGTVDIADLVIMAEYWLEGI